MFLLLTRYHYWLDEVVICNCGQYRILVNRGQIAMNLFQFSMHAFKDVVKYSIRGLNHQLILSVLF